MKSLKFIAVFVLIFIFTLPAIADKRVEPKPITEYTDLKSPFPYPKNRTEIIADFLYYIKKYCLDSDNGSHEIYLDGGGFKSDSILVDLLNPQPIYKIGKIFKVKNRIAEYPDDHSWLILVMDRNGKVALRAAMFATGVMAMYTSVEVDKIETTSPELKKIGERRRRVITEEYVRNIFSVEAGRLSKKHEVKKVELTSFFSPMGNILFPVWEVSMTDGTTYYYRENEDIIYGIEKKVSWKRGKNGFRQPRSQLTSHSSYLADTINDELIVLEIIPEK
jgi:hypothetical protein